MLVADSTELSYLSRTLSTTSTVDGTPSIRLSGCILSTIDRPESGTRYGMTKTIFGPGRRGPT
jgi:hypothetical protein